ncbi:ABC transporter substrate-binding protein [Paenibacillus prosopidis]|uniref:Carbohydrate ABC transporter substrate-binding protein (CUT1 family) n=1 Tax=Paenibacillus prosopidis TaxID=630520 RepID=A0A368W7K3_9BACL|nr:extracellular solute-binding protein [Paenibacillus prosopidis]RCW48424.1 carbohydrate ABC transporter substrate-binding protein (CUT1 family) [Paenibacillus prosopidis]
MRIRKMMILLCAMVLVLAACGGGSNSGTNSGTNTANNGTNSATNSGATDTPDNAAANNEEEVYSTPEMDFDLGGKTIKIVSWWDMTIPEDNPDNIQRKKNLDALMEKHNFKVEYVAIDYGEYQQKVTASLLAGEPIGDIVRLGKTYTVPTLVKQDLLWPIDEYTKNPRAFNQKVTNEYYQYEGRGYGFSEGHANLVQGLFYNRTLMNQLGLKALQEYVNEDNWNWETFIQVAKEANKDTNNDGKLDTWGLANPSLPDQALYSNNTGLTKGDKQNLDDPATLDALNFVSRLATEQVGRPTEGGDWTEAGQFFRQGNTLMVAGALWELSGMQTDMPDYELGFVPFPKGPNATEYHSAEALYQALTIPKAVENPEQLMYIWEKINDIDSMYDYPDQGWYETLFTNEDDINNAKMVAPNMIILDHNTFPNLKYYDFMGELTSGVSVSTVVEKYKSAFQAAIDEVYAP